MTAAPRVPGYDLNAPTEALTLAALQRVWDPERGAAIWARACKAAGLRPGHVRDIPALERAIAALAAEGGASATVARSVEIRLRTYARLSARANAPQPARPTDAGAPR